MEARLESPTGAMTLAEWGELTEDEAGEFVDGQLVEDEDVGLLHDVVVAWVIQLLRAWLAPQGGIVGASDTRFAVSRTRGRKPDVYAYLPGRRPPATGLVHDPPDIMVEVVSGRPKDARRDRIEKRPEYAAFGVRLYWIVDPNERTFEVFELGADGRYAAALGAAEGVVAVPSCEGHSVDLDRLWDEVDRLEG